MNTSSLMAEREHLAKLLEAKDKMAVSLGFKTPAEPSLAEKPAN